MLIVTIFKNVMITSIGVEVMGHFCNDLIEKVILNTMQIK